MASKIGLYVYQLSLYRTGQYQRLRLTDSGIGSELVKFIPRFVQRKRGTNQNNAIERSWRLEPAKGKTRSFHGLVHYGTYGYSSKIINPNDNEILYDRSALDVEEIPLYYRFWIPDSGNFGFLVLQSYRDRSCVQQVLGEFVGEFNRSHDEVRVMQKKIMPVSDEVYAKKKVKKLILSKKKVPRDRADLLRDFPPEEINIELTFSARKSKSFGYFSDVAPLIRESRGGAAFLFEGIEFEEASALVAMGDTYMKVGIVGPSNNAGVIDITDDVALSDDQHPVFDSISTVVDDVIRAFRKQFGMK